MVDAMIVLAFALAGCLVAFGYCLRGVVGGGLSSSAPATKQQLDETENRLMAKLSTLAATLTAIADGVDKVKVEVQALKDSLGDVDLPAEAEAALERLTVAVKAVDDINPDA